MIGNGVWNTWVRRDNALIGLVNRREMSIPSFFAITVTKKLQSLTFACAIPFSPQFKFTTARLLIPVLLFRLARKTFASDVEMVDPEQQLTLLSVLGERLRYKGRRRHIKVQVADDSEV